MTSEAASIIPPASGALRPVTSADSEQPEQHCGNDEYNCDHWNDGQQDCQDESCSDSEDKTP